MTIKQLAQFINTIDVEGQEDTMHINFIMQNKDKYTLKKGKITGIIFVNDYTLELVGEEDPNITW